MALSTGCPVDVDVEVDAVRLALLAADVAASAGTTETAAMPPTATTAKAIALMAILLLGKAFPNIVLLLS
jgi:hypothetical protein